MRVEGDAYGILPSLVGRAYGVVGVTGMAFGKLPQLIGEATGAVGAAGGAYGQPPAVTGSAEREAERPFPDDDDLALLLLAA